MALAKGTIKTDIAAAFKAVMDDQTDDRNGAIDRLADQLANAMIAAIQSATIVYTAGLTTPTGGGPVTGTFNGKLQ